MREQKQEQFLMQLQSSEWFLGTQLQCLRTVQNGSGYDAAIPPKRFSTVQGMLLAILPERFRTVQRMLLQSLLSLLNGSERFLRNLSDERFRTVQNGSELYACSVRCLLDGLQNGSERFRGMGMGSNAPGTVQNGSGARVPMPPERFRTVHGHAVWLPPFLGTVREHAAGGSKS